MINKWLAGLVALSLALSVAGSALAAQAATGVSSEFTHLLFGVKDGQLKVFHLVKLKNQGASSSGPIELSLPKGYQNPAFSGDAGGAMAKEVQLGSEGLKDPRGLEPGAARDYVLTYDLPMPPDGQSLRVNVNYPTQMILILADQATVQMVPLQNRDFSSQGSVQYGQKTFEQFARNDVAPGTTLTMTLGPATPGGAQPGGAGQPGGGMAHEPPPGTVTKGTIALLNQAFHGGASNMMMWQRFTGTTGHGGLVGSIIILAGLTVLIFGLGRTFYVRWQLKQGINPETGERPEETFEKLLKEKSIYIKKIADLDRKAEAGEITSEEHQERRSAYKRRLVKVLARLKEVEN